MNRNLNKDILVGVLFMLGLFGFLAGEFIMSTVVFASSAIFSNIDFYRDQSC